MVHGRQGARAGGPQQCAAELRLAARVDGDDRLDRRGVHHGIVIRAALLALVGAGHAMDRCEAVRLARHHSGGGGQWQRAGGDARAVDGV